jgi:uncharacterized delta-60 repeat protein
MRLNTWPHLLSGTALAFTFTLACATVAYADGPGDLDTTFNGTGVVTTTVASDTDGAEAVAIQSDGKIVVAGDSYSSPKFNVTLARYRPDGRLDVGFGRGGVVTTPISSGFDGAHGVAIQPGDGKIVAAGVSGRDGVAGSDFAVVRYQGDGNLDLTFNGTGIVTTTVGSNSAGCAVAIQPDGSIVVAGLSWRPGSGANRDIAVVRYTSSGALDASFNYTGIVTTSIGNYAADVTAVAIQPDDKIVVVGRSDSALAIARYTITGSLDTSFNGNGIVTTSIGSYANAAAVAIQPDGKIVTAGGGWDSTHASFALVRYGNSGELDTTFNGTGIVTTSIGGSGSATSATLQADGKIVAVGGSSNGPDSSNFAVARYNSDGSLDASFNHTGVVTTSTGSLSAALSVAIQPGDGKIVVSGINGTSNHFKFIVARYLGQDSHSYFCHLPVILKRR